MAHTETLVLASPEAEQAVLGGLMLDSNAWERVSDKLSEEDFTRREHRLIYRAIAALAAVGGTVDILTVENWLKECRQLDNAGGLAYLASIANNTPSAANVGAYAGIVREHADRRRRLAELDEERKQILKGGHGKRAKIEAVSVGLLRGCDIKPEPVAWLWDGWLAAGKMHILAGAPGTGKTTISMALAATVTTGGRWPDGSRSSAGNVVIWSGEDDPADTLIPRLAASGAEVGRVYFIADVRHGNERRSFDPARDMEALRHELLRIGDVRLLIVDPIVSAVAGDSHKNAEVRRGLQPLADLAMSTRCALLGITHFSKGTGGRDPVERLTGSLAFGALARVVMVAAKHQEEGENGRDVRLFLRAKSNIGPDDGGFEYDLRQGELTTHPGIFASCVLWGDAAEGKARELLAMAETVAVQGDQTEQGEAIEWLREQLSECPLASKEVKQLASQDGLAWATVRRAQKAMGIKPGKTRFDGGWEWALPSKMLKSTQDAQQKEVSILGQDEHLRVEEEERAAIMEYNGGLSRAEAERLALADPTENRTITMPCTDPEDGRWRG